MGALSIDIGGTAAKPYYDYLNLSITDYGEQKLEEKTAEIEQRESQKMQAVKSGPSTLTYILLGVGAVAILTLAVLKKKGVI